MLRIFLVLSALVSLNLFSSVLYAQKTKIFWIHESEYNGKVQIADIDGTGLSDIITNKNMPCGLAIDSESDPQKIYFSERGTSKIIRANLDGTGQEDVITDISGIRDIELDPINRKIYWVRDTYNDDAVQRADMDSLNSNIETLYHSSYTYYGFYGIALDLINQRVYWTQANNGCNDKIQRINFDGSGFKTVIQHPQSALINPWDIDVVGDRIYWTDPGLSEDVILSADLEGAAIDTVIKDVNCQYFVIDTVTATIFWTENNKVCSAGLDGSGRTELISGLGNFLMGIAIAYNVTTTSTESIFGPSRDYILYQNYPNPFNPVTAISYQLPAFSEVDLSIYNLLGQKVATLVSKQQPAGKYQVEWDASGMASGVYLYKLRTDQGFTQTRKLVLLK